MSSVRKKDQSPHRFTLADTILDMYDHTMTVTANPKKFNPEFAQITDRITFEAGMIYHLCRVANEELDNRKKDEAEQRIELQREAIDHCKWLKTFIMLAKKKFHLSAKSVGYWNGLVNKSMDGIKNWNTTEIRDYKDKYGL